MVRRPASLFYLSVPEKAVGIIPLELRIMLLQHCIFGRGYFDAYGKFAFLCLDNNL